MAQFMRGEKSSLLRRLGIMHGRIRVRGSAPVRILTLADGQDKIMEMVSNNSPDDEIEAFSEGLHQAARAGVCANLKDLAEQIKAQSLPADFATEWQVLHSESGNEEGYEGNYILLYDLKKDDLLNDFRTVLNGCEELFQAEEMTLHEAIWVLRQVIDYLQPEAVDSIQH